METLFRVTGIVKKGQNQGKALGYPTANIPLEQSIPEGIYASTVFVNDKAYAAVSFVGAAKTFDRIDTNVESYIFDFSEEIYDNEITVILHKFLRGNKKFETVAALVEQMKQDVIDAKAYFAEQ